MRVHAAALAALLLLAPAALLWPDPAPSTLVRGGTAEDGSGPLDGPAATSIGRFDATYQLNDTRVRPPTLPDWPTEEGCILLQSAGVTTLTMGGLYVTWSAADLTGAEVLTLRVEPAGADPMEVTGRSPMDLRLDGLELLVDQPTRITLYAADTSPLFVHQQAKVRMGWDMTGAPMRAQYGCEVE